MPVLHIDRRNIVHDDIVDGHHHRHHGHDQSHTETDFFDLDGDHDCDNGDDCDDANANDDDSHDYRDHGRNDAANDDRCADAVSDWQLPV